MKRFVSIVVDGFSQLYVDSRLILEIASKTAKKFNELSSKDGGGGEGRERSEAISPL